MKVFLSPHIIFDFVKNLFILSAAVFTSYLPFLNSLALKYYAMIILIYKLAVSIFTSFFIWMMPIYFSLMSNLNYMLKKKP